MYLVSEGIQDMALIQINNLSQVWEIHSNKIIYDYLTVLFRSIQVAGIFQIFRDFSKMQKKSTFGQINVMHDKSQICSVYDTP